MKKKISKIWGVGLVVVLVTSLLAFAAPVSAGTLSWSAETIPSITGEMLVPGADVNDFGVSGDGLTVYAVSPGSELIGLVVTTVLTSTAGSSDNDTVVTVTFTNQEGTPSRTGTATLSTALAVGAVTAVTPTVSTDTVRDVTNVTHVADNATTGVSAGAFSVIGATSGVSFGTASITSTTALTYTDGSIPKGIYKSTNAGVSWTVLANPANINTSIDLIAVAPDNASVVAVVADGVEVSATTNGGSTWGNLPEVKEGTAGTAATINDIAVSPASAGTNYVAVVGTESGGVANMWRWGIGAAVPAWDEGHDRSGWSSANTTAAVAFSPNFASDLVMVVLTQSDGVGVKFQIFSESTDYWNASAGFGASYPVTVVADDGITDLTSASISLNPSYLGGDESTRIAFVGLNIAGDTDAVAKSGLYRLDDAETPVTMKTGSTMDINSVAFNGTTLVAGLYISNIVYRCDNPLSSDPTVRAIATLKRPGGVDRGVLTWAGTNVLAGTRGNESAFSVSRDNGNTFNDLSLIDTALTNLEDVGVSADGSKVYLASNDGSDMSLWRGPSPWERVLSAKTLKDFIVRVAPDNPDVVYVADTGTATIYHTENAGTTWFTRTGRYSTQDLAVQSADIAYVAVTSAKTVSKSTNKGFTWGTAVDTRLTTGNLATITSVGTGLLVVGSTEGYVSYSTDSGANWTPITTQLDVATAAQVTASGLATNDYIYAATAGDEMVERWQIGQTATTWKDLDVNEAANAYAYGIALKGSALYVASSDGTDSKLLRTLEPTHASPAQELWSKKSATTETFVRPPSALRLSATATTVILWAISTTGTDELHSLTDTLALTGPTLTTPADAKAIAVNPVSGKSYDVTFTWTRPSTSVTTYNLQIALDKDFIEVVRDIGADAGWNPTGDPTSPSFVLGPGNASTGSILEYMPDTTYYWRVRVAIDGPIFSPWSATRSFKIGTLAVEPPVPTLLSPANGGTGVTISLPAFSWSPIPGATAATRYAFILAVSPTAEGFAAPVATLTVAEPAVRPLVELDYDRTYFWKVRVSAPTVGRWSTVANFTTMAKPVEPPPPIVVREMPAPIIQIPAPIIPPAIVIPPAPPPPAPITPAYIWAIVIIGAVLVIAVIVLIVRTRRPV